MAIEILRAMKTQWEQLPQGQWLAVQNGQFVQVPKRALTRWERVQNYFEKDYGPTSYEAVTALVIKVHKEATKQLIQTTFALNETWLEKHVSLYGVHAVSRRSFAPKELCEAYDFELKNEKIEGLGRSVQRAIDRKFRWRPSSLCFVILSVFIDAIIMIPRFILSMFWQPNTRRNNFPNLLNREPFTIRKVLENECRDEEDDPINHNCYNSIRFQLHSFHNHAEPHHICTTIHPFQSRRRNDFVLPLPHNE